MTSRPQMMTLTPSSSMSLGLSLTPNSSSMMALSLMMTPGSMIQRCSITSTMNRCITVCAVLTSDPLLIGTCISQHRPTPPRPQHTPCVTVYTLDVGQYFVQVSNGLFFMFSSTYTSFSQRGATRVDHFYCRIKYTLCFTVRDMYVELVINAITDLWPESSAISINCIQGHLVSAMCTIVHGSTPHGIGQVGLRLGWAVWGLQLKWGWS